MIAHQRPRMHPLSMASADPLKPLQKRLVILFLDKSPLPAVTTRHDVINRSRILESWWSGQPALQPTTAQATSKF